MITRVFASTVQLSVVLDRGVFACDLPSTTFTGSSVVPSGVTFCPFKIRSMHFPPRHSTEVIVDVAQMDAGGMTMTDLLLP